MVDLNQVIQNGMGQQLQGLPAAGPENRVVPDDHLIIHFQQGHADRNAIVFGMILAAAKSYTTSLYGSMGTMRDTLIGQ
ncbi:hypothetical protein [Mesorhizobium waimense]|uniref:hypothetical protein n=1 Tax=Mesorhizobium waimense TaxID=1300307 RepID=UPI0011C4A9F0|nr:hypothetical protein [Mesorhizobium waimense]